MPSSTEPPRPAFGQVWRWADTTSDLILISPRPTVGAWDVMFLRFGWGSGTPMFSSTHNIVTMYGLYPDRPPIEGYTYLGDAE